MIKKIDHIGIAVTNTDEALRFYAEALGLQPILQQVVEEQGVKATFLTIGESLIELLEPIREDSPVGKFLLNRGEGIHHVSVEVDDVAATVASLNEQAVQMIDTTPRRGAHGMQVAFVHPKAAHGVLLELVQPAEE